MSLADGGDNGTLIPVLDERRANSVLGHRADRIERLAAVGYLLSLVPADDLDFRGLTACRVSTFAAETVLSISNPYLPSAVEQWDGIAQRRPPWCRAPVIAWILNGIGKTPAKHGCRVQWLNSPESPLTRRRKKVAVRYPENKQKELLDRVKALLSEGNSMNSACSAVSSRERGLPTTNTLAKWAKAANLSSATANPNSASEKRESAITPPTENPPSAEAPEDPAIAFDEHLARVPASAAEPVADSAAGTIPGNGDGASPTVDVDEHTAELVHVTTGGFEEAVEENRYLRRALDEANREIRAMRDLLVVYASR